MKRKNRILWNKLQKARNLELQKEQLLREIFEAFDNDEREINLHASNSNNLEETISCFIDYGEDDDKLFSYLERR